MNKSFSFVWIKSYYFKVKLFNTLAELGEYFKQNPGARKKLHGRTVPLESSRCLGEIYLSREGLELDVAAHEAFHAALVWARRLKYSAEFHEEEIAKVVGDLTKQLMNKLK